MTIKEFLGTVKGAMLDETKLPKHVAIAVNQSAKDNEQLLLNIKNIIKFNCKLSIPILTLQLPHQQDSDTDFIVHLFQQLAGWDFAEEEQLKITVLGKWYALPSRAID